MKTTLSIDDSVMVRLKEEAARRRTTMSELVETALRTLLDKSPKKTPSLPPLPVADLGKPLVDVSDRDALYQAMDED